jgi:hypothetical protein
MDGHAPWNCIHLDEKLIDQVREGFGFEVLNRPFHIIRKASFETIVHHEERFK